MPQEICDYPAPGAAAFLYRMWRPQLAALAAEYTVVAWDEPGAGRSSDVPADFALADYASCLAVSSNTASCSACAISPTCTISGLKEGLPLAA